jgi:hypothetical protein
MPVKKICSILIFSILLAPAISTAQWHSGISAPFEKISTGINEIKESVNETKELFVSINKFIKTVSAPVKKISSLIGGTTLILLISVLIISSGLGALGIPKGRFTFFTALLVADSLWLAWGSSINADMFIYLLKIAKTNIILLSPVIIFLLAKKYSPGFFSIIKNKITGKSIGIKEAEFLTERFSDESLVFIKSLSSDTGKEGQKGAIFLSDASRKSLARIKELLEKFPG